MKKHRWKFLFVACCVLTTFVVALILASAVVSNEAFAERVVELGYVGIIIAAFVSGLDLFVPIPTTAFVPVFTAAGFSLFVVIAFMVVGTFVADLLSYYVGWYGNRVEKVRTSHLYARLHAMVEKNRARIVPLFFLYVAFIPMPNEVLLMPLGLLGYRISTLILPLFFGIVISVSIAAYGAEALFSLTQTLSGADPGL